MTGSKKPDKEVDAAKNKVSRRTFLTTSGAIIAVDAIVSSATGKAAGDGRWIVLNSRISRNGSTGSRDSIPKMASRPRQL